MKPIIRKPDSDFQDAFENNPGQPFKVLDVTNVLATIPGHNDEDAWHWVVKLDDGRFFYVTASCDYTGWDCQSSCDCQEAPTAIKAAELSGEYSEQLKNQIKGSQPFGLEIKEAL